ncbi:MAG: UvrD-helicase domain-containing protein [Candidatus Riflebacteria bacterium]|nr:UvrD-helicase domain-containing protein [Candidatus Riflebacteria bacterium]
MPEPRNPPVAEPSVTILTASAGTGKTFNIIQTALDLVLDEGVPVERLLIVTYTERAAGELRRRLWERLSQPLAEPPGDLREARRLAARAALDRAAISTIHEFCFSVLRQFAFEAGEPFEQQVVDGDGLFPDLFDRYVEGPMKRFLLEEGNLDRFGTLAFAADFYRDRVADGFRHFHPGAGRLFPDPETTPDADSLCRGLVDALAQVSPTGRSPAARAALARFHQACRDRLADPPAATLAVTAGEGSPWQGILSGKLELIKAVGKVFQEDGLDPAALEAMILGLYLEVSAPELRLQARLIVDLVRRRAAWLREHGGIDYQEMLARTRNALAGSLRLREQVRQRFLVGLVDEFQDTDPVQWDVFRLLFTAEEGRPAEPGRRLVLVGDPKQAIYGFRGADVQTFERVVADLTASGRAVPRELNRTYRSTPGLVANLNRLFGVGGFPDGFRPVAAAGEPAPVLTEGEGPDPHPLRAVGFTVEGAGPRRQAWAQFLAGEIRRLLAAPPLLSRGKEQRPLRADDICILVRGRPDERAILPVLEEAGIPYISGRQKDLFQTREAREFLLLLQAIAAPGDDHAVRKALLTRFFAIPPALVEGVTGLPPRHPVARLLRGWGRLARRREWARLFDRILQETGILLRAAQEPEGEARVTALQDLARELALLGNGQGRCLAELVRDLDRLQGARAVADREGAPLRIDSELPRVWVMTMHSAKGLEFPVVFVAGGFGSSPGRGLRRYHDEDGCRVLDLSPLHKDLAGEEGKAEEMRVFYVALTRAIFRLYLPCIRPGQGVGPLGRVGLAVGAAWPPGAPSGQVPAGEPLPEFLTIDERGRVLVGGGLQPQPSPGPVPSPGCPEGKGASDTPAGGAGPEGTMLPPVRLPPLAEPGPRHLERGSGAVLAVSSFTSLSRLVTDEEEAPAEFECPADEVGEAAGPAGTGGAMVVGAELAGGAGFGGVGLPGPAGLGGPGLPGGAGLEGSGLPGGVGLDGAGLAGGALLDGAGRPGGPGLVGVGPAGGARSGGAEPPGAVMLDGAGLPGGTRCGTLLHKIFEQIDDRAVAAADEPGALLAEGNPTGGLIDRFLRRYPLRRHPDPADRGRVAGILWRTLRTPLPGLGRLCDLERHRHEVPFWMPAPGARAKDLLGMRLADGYLTGSIDLVFPVGQDWYLVDFKSNRTPTGGFDPESLEAVMAHHHYDLQAMLYGLAWHRRVAGSPGGERVAGAFYLFGRGLTGEAGSPGIVFRAFSPEGFAAFEREKLPVLLARSGEERK